MKKRIFSDLEAREWEHEDLKLKEESAIKKCEPNY